MLPRMPHCVVLVMLVLAAGMARGNDAAAEDTPREEEEPTREQIEFLQSFLESEAAGAAMGGEWTRSSKALPARETARAPIPASRLPPGWACCNKDAEAETMEKAARRKVYRRRRPATQQRRPARARRQCAGPRGLRPAPSEAWGVGRACRR